MVGDNLFAADFEAILDDGLRDYLPPLDEASEENLRRSISELGVRDRVTIALVDGEYYQADGMNRIRIAGELGKPCPFEVREFADKEAVFEWMLQNQLGRRNLSPEEFTEFIGKLYNLRKKAKGGLKEKGTGEGSTAKAIADEYGVSERTVHRSGKAAEALESCHESVQELKRQKVLTNADVSKLSKLDHAEQAAVTEKLKSGGKLDEILKEVPQPPKKPKAAKPPVEEEVEEFDPAAHIDRMKTMYYAPMIREMDKAFRELDGKGKVVYRTYCDAMKGMDKVIRDLRAGRVGK